MQIYQVWLPEFVFLTSRICSKQSVHSIFSTSFLPSSFPSLLLPLILVLSRDLVNIYRYKILFLYVTPWVFESIRDSSHISPSTSSKLMSSYHFVGIVVYRTCKASSLILLPALHIMKGQYYNNSINPSSSNCRLVADISRRVSVKCTCKGSGEKANVNSLFKCVEAFCTSKAIC